MLFYSPYGVSFRIAMKTFFIVSGFSMSNKRSPGQIFIGNIYMDKFREKDLELLPNRVLYMFSKQTHKIIFETNPKTSPAGEFQKCLLGATQPVLRENIIPAM